MASARLRSLSNPFDASFAGKASAVAPWRIVAVQLDVAGIAGNHAFLQIGRDRVGILGGGGEKSVRHLLRQVYRKLTSSHRSPQAKRKQRRGGLCRRGALRRLKTAPLR
jgi:hypothetical protein